MDGNLIYNTQPMSLCLNEDFEPNSIVIKHVRFQQKCGCNITNLLAQALDVDKFILEVTVRITICYLNLTSTENACLFWTHFFIRLLQIFIYVATHTFHLFCLMHYSNFLGVQHVWCSQMYLITVLFCLESRKLCGKIYTALDSNPKRRLIMSNTVTFLDCRT